MVFALAAVPIVLAGGGLVDFARMYVVEASMQDALDGAALMLSKTAPSMTGPQIQASASDLFYANFDGVGVDLESVTLTPSYQPNDPSITVKGTATVKTNFLGLVGIREVPITASSTVVWGETKLRVGLVLDNTGSMASAGKMDALKVATKKLLAQLQTAEQDAGDVYVSLIPFAKDINAGAANVDEAWVRWDLWEEVNGSCSNRRYSDQTSCVRRGGTWTPDDHTTWNGCITDRDQNYDTRNTEPSQANQATLFPADQYANCPAPYMGLTNDWRALTGAVDAMRPDGLTNQAIGLQWGWQSLTAAPFTVPPYDEEYEYREVIILLSDGLNTRDRWYSNAAEIDRRQRLTCANVKAAGIGVYTVQVNTGNDPVSTLLQECASNPDQFFLLNSADQIVTTFESIGTQLAQLRVSE